MVEHERTRLTEVIMRQLKRWYFLLRGQPYAYGPIGPMTLEKAKEDIRESWGNGNKLPHGTQIWRE